MIFQATIQSIWKGENKSIVKHQERPIGDVFYLFKARLALWAAVKEYQGFRPVAIGWSGSFVCGWSKIKRLKSKVVNPGEGCFKFSVEQTGSKNIRGKPKPTGISRELRKSKWKILVSFGRLAGCKKSYDAEALVSPSTKDFKVIIEGNFRNTWNG